LRVAVLAVDPSSARSGGSILGDKTRMEQLSRDPNAFIRPSPSQTELGGVARRTREVIALAEAAGFDVVIVETVGVGQSETLVAQMTDIFTLLLAPGGGDELQGVKRGIMEIADLILVNKADGEMKAQAGRTCADYAGALRLFRKRPGDPEDFPKALTVSAVTGDGIATAWDEMRALVAHRRPAGSSTRPARGRTATGSTTRCATASCATWGPTPRRARAWKSSARRWRRATRRPRRRRTGCWRCSSVATGPTDAAPRGPYCPLPLDARGAIAYPRLTSQIPSAGRPLVARLGHDQTRIRSCRACAN